MRITRFGFESLLLLALLARPLDAMSTWTIPGVVSAPGLNGTHFVSDVTVTNPGTTTANVTFTYFPSAAPATSTIALTAGETVVYRNVLAALYGLGGGAGAISVTSDQPLLLRARTYNDAAAGTFGVALPVVADERFLVSGDVAETFWISQDAGNASGFRTNVAVVFPDEGGGSAIVTVYDPDGHPVGHQTFSLDGAGFQQLSVASFAGAVPVGRATVQVTRGRATAYAVVVDNVTGDSSLFRFEDLPAGAQDVLVNGVARANGRNGTFFRTDGRFYNPTDADANVTVSFHASGNSNPSPLTKAFVLPKGKVTAVVDLLDALLGLPAGSTGALRFRSDRPVGILCRTSNVDPTGARPGTFGSQQKPVPLLSFLNSADAGAAVTGIRQNAAFRTNVGFAAGADGASCSLTLEARGGAAVANGALNLEAFGWSQPSIAELFPGAAIPDDATLLVRVTQGSVDVYDSSIDNSSGDSVVTPVAPLPASLPSSATIGASGGTIRSADGRLTLRIPAGALAQPATVSLQSVAGDAPQATGSAYSIQPPGLSFAVPALLTFAYGTADTESSSADALSVVLKTGSGWYVVSGSSTDTSARTVTTRLGGTSPSALLRAAKRSRSIALEPLLVIGLARNWVLVPTGRRTVLTDGSLSFIAYSLNPTGPPEEDPLLFPLGKLIPISSSPLEVEVTWYVNDVELGDLENGTIATAGNSGIYKAPACPPSENPVHIRFAIADKENPLIAANGHGEATVRVLKRKWKLLSQNITFQIFSCVDHITDIIHFNTTIVEFTLDDSFVGNGKGDTKPTSHALGACRAACGPGVLSIGTPGTEDSSLSLEVSGSWGSDPLDERRDSMRLQVLSASYGGLTGTTTVCTVEGIPVPGLPIPAEEDAFKFTDGENNDFHLEDGQATVRRPQPERNPGGASTPWGPLAMLELKYTLVGVCP